MKHVFSAHAKPPRRPDRKSELELTGVVSQSRVRAESGPAHQLTLTGRVHMHVVKASYFG